MLAVVIIVLVLMIVEFVRKYRSNENIARVAREAEAERWHRLYVESEFREASTAAASEIREERVRAAETERKQQEE